MLVIFWFGVFFDASLAAFTSFCFHPRQLHARGQSTMRDQIADFVCSLQLSPSDARLLTGELENDSSLSNRFSGGDSNAPAPITPACRAAQLALGTDNVLIAPFNQTELEANWSQTCTTTPACIIFPSSAPDVSKTLKFVTFFSLKFAIRSGGHSPNPGWSSIDSPGVIIDLSKLKQISISDDKQVLSLGPGGRWGDVYTFLDPHGVSVIGGRIPQIGVAGVILGGGYFHFSGEYGLAGDNVKNFEVVLADGRIVDANASTNSDLFWSLKGGGANFGIVTRFDLYTIPVHNIWYQVSIHSSEQVPAILDAFAEWQQNGGLDVKSTVALIIGLETTTLGLIYSAPADKPAAFSSFYDIPSIMIAVPPANGTVLTLTNILGSTFSNVPQRHDYHGVSSQIDAQLYKDVYTHWLELARAAHETTGTNQTFTIQPVPIKLVEAGIVRGGNPLGLPKINHQWWTTLIDWKDAKDDSAARAASVSTSEKWRQLSQERGLAIDFLFMNDGSRDQSPLQWYGANNIRKLKEVSRKYDPLQVFQNLQNDGFLLRKV